MKYNKKQKTHKLTDKQAAQRLARGSTYRRWVSQRKLPYIVTLDEMYLSTNDTTGKRDCYYETKGKPAPSEYKKKEHSGWPPKILCAIGVCHRGSTSLRIVPEIQPVIFERANRCLHKRFINVFFIQCRYVSWTLVLKVSSLTGLLLQMQAFYLIFYCGELGYYCFILR